MKMTLVRITGRVVLGLRGHLLRLSRTVVMDHESAVFFSYHPRQGEGLLDPRVRVYSPDEAIPDEVRLAFVRSRSLSEWLRVWTRRSLHGTTLLFLFEEDRLSAYGTIRVRDPFVRRYRWLTPRGTLLGPFWVDSARRGLGLYGVMLNQCIALSTKSLRRPIIVHTDDWNGPSIRGLEKAGFERLGWYEVTWVLRGLWSRHKVIEENTTIEEIWSGLEPASPRAGPVHQSGHS
jgi:RimJ/RimL family protein N-acetyltransferase